MTERSALPLWWRLFMSAYRALLLAFAVLAPLSGIAFALNHQLDATTAWLVFLFMPGGCLGAYFFSHEIERSVKRKRLTRMREQRRRSPQRL